MKTCIVFILMLVLFSCADQKTVENEVLVAKEVTTKKVSEKTNTYVSDKLPVVNFNALETQYLNQEDTNTTYVLNFWATWCKPCVKELPHFEQLQEAYKDQGVNVVLVSLDFPENIEKQVLPFIEKHQLQSAVILLDDPDANTWIPKVDSTWTGAIPATLLVKGNEQQFYEQSFTYSELETVLKSIL